MDILGTAVPLPHYRTRVRMLWDHDALYLLAELEEPNLWATLTEHDSVIFHDHDFELFLDPDGDGEFYVELEINALNTTWDLLLPKAYRAGGPPVDGFDLVGLRSAVHLHGTLNDPSDRDDGWEMVIAIPWRGLKQIAGVRCPPSLGESWRINFSRVEWDLTVSEGIYQKRLGVPEHNWVWSPQGMVDMHQPERWGYLDFTDGAEAGRYEPYPNAARWLSALFHAQRAYRLREGVFSATVPLLSDAFPAEIDYVGTPEQFMARLGGWRINHEGRLTRAES